MTSTASTSAASPPPSGQAKATSVPPRKPARSGSRITLKRRQALIGLAFAAPMFILFIMFRFGPAIAGVGLSFFDFDIIDSALEWEGLANFQRMLADPLFFNAMRITLIYAVIAVPLTLAVATGFALAVRRVFRGVGFFRSVFFLPVVTSLVLAGTIFVWVFSSSGPVPALAGALGFSGESWLTSRALVIPALALVGIWSRFGYGMLILLAALQDIPRELEEAALTDGAGPWARFRYIILPHLKPSLFFLAVIETTGSFQVFDLIYVMTQGGPSHGSYSLVYMLYDQGFKYFDYGYAAALGTTLFIMTLVIAYIQRKFLGSKD